MKKYLLLVLLASVFNCYGQKFPWKTSTSEAQGLNSLTLSNGIRELQQAGTTPPANILKIREEYPI